MSRVEKLVIVRQKETLVRYSTWWRGLILFTLVCMSPSLATQAIGGWFKFAINPLSDPGSLFSALGASTAIAILICVSESGIRFNETGFILPPYLAPFFRFRRKFQWSAVQRITMKELSLATGKVVFTLFNGDEVTIDLALANPKDRDLVFEALEQYANDVDSDERIRFLKTTPRCQNWPPKESQRSIEQTLNEDKQLTLRYSTKLRLFFLTISFLLFPVWGILALFGSMALPFVLFSAFKSAGLLLLICPFILAGGIIALAASFDTALTVGESGISFPLYMAPLLKFRRDRAWNKIKRIRFIARGEEVKDGDLQFIFQHDNVSVSLRELTSADLEKLLLAINIWAQNVEQDIEIKVLQESMSNHKLGLSGPSYTKMWEDEMNRRFTSTGFVPLQEGHSLKNGALCLVKAIAYGGLSAVYLVQERNTDLRVLKEFVVPDANAELQSKARELFERESKILMKLSHPCLARVYDCFVEDGRTYLLLEYIPGTDLRQIVTQKGPIDESTVRQWAQQLVEILSYLHQQEPPVIHRDLTPDNILLTADNQIKLIDFGAANEFVGTATGTLVGKQSFISPEQFRGDTIPQSDIYSFGATLYYLLTAAEPIPLTQSFPKTLAPHVSDEIDQLVADCTSFSPEDRLSSLGLLASRLRRYNQVT